MTRDRAKELLPIIKAFSEGRDIEFYDYSLRMWATARNPLWYDDFEFRIKELPTYIPFDDQDIDKLRDKWVKSIKLV